MKNCATLRWENTSRKARCLSGLLRPLILLTLRMHHRILHFRAPSPFLFPSPSLISPPPPPLHLPSPLPPPPSLQKQGKKGKNEKEHTRKNSTSWKCRLVSSHLSFFPAHVVLPFFSLNVLFFFVRGRNLSPFCLIPVLVVNGLCEEDAR